MADIDDDCTAEELEDFEADHGDLEDQLDALLDFADPGGRSALRAAGPGNPRNLPCPTCKEPDRLTPADVARSYVCDTCADSLEGHGP